MKKTLSILTSLLLLSALTTHTAYAKGYMPSPGTIYVESSVGFDTAKIGPTDSTIKDPNIKYVTHKKYNAKDLASLKKGESSLVNVLWAVEVGDASVKKAAENAGIKKVYYVDSHWKQVNALGYFFYRKLVTTVYGE